METLIFFWKKIKTVAIFGNSKIDALEILYIFRSTDFIKQSFFPFSISHLGAFKFFVWSVDQVLFSFLEISIQHWMLVTPFSSCFLFFYLTGFFLSFWLVIRFVYERFLAYACWYYFLTLLFNYSISALF